MSNLCWNKKMVLLRLSQCKHHTASTVMHKHPAGGWVLIRKHGGPQVWAPIITLSWINTHTYTHTYTSWRTQRHSQGYYSCLCSEWQPFISVCLQAKWLSSMHPTIRKCHKHTSWHTHTHTRMQAHVGARKHTQREAEVKYSLKRPVWIRRVSLTIGERDSPHLLVLETS